MWSEIPKNAGLAERLRAAGLQGVIPRSLPPAVRNTAAAELTAPGPFPKVNPTTSRRATPKPMPFAELFASVSRGGYRTYTPADVTQMENTVVKITLERMPNPRVKVWQLPKMFAW